MTREPGRTPSLGYLSSPDLASDGHWLPTRLSSLDPRPFRFIVLPTLATKRWLHAYAAAATWINRLGSSFRTEFTSGGPSVRCFAWSGRAWG